MKKYGFLVLVAGILVALDQVVKLYIHTHYSLGESTPVIQDLFHLTYVRNPGAAFGFLAESHPAFREVFFLAMPPIAMLVILMMLRQVQESDFWQITAFSFVFGGALGNYIDRVRFRYVIDYLDFHYKEWSWPAFNIADMAIVGGVSVLLILMFFEEKRNSPNGT
ncbi:MAG: signal peptidase II [Bdellovibrio sp.]